MFEIEGLHSYHPDLPMDAIISSRFFDATGDASLGDIVTVRGSMPGILLTLSGDPDADLVCRVVPEMTALVCDVLDKRPDATMVLVRFVPRESWYVRGKSMAEHDRNAFRLEVTLTEDTNTKMQKARFHQKAFELLSRLIGNLHPHSNIHILECSATGYGYGGVTQEYRHQHPES